MHPLLKNFLGAVVGIALYKSVVIISAPASAEFDYATEAIEAVAIAVVVTLVLVLFERWRGHEKSAEK